MTDEWLGHLIGQRVTGHKVGAVLEAGVTSDSAIFELSYAAEGSGPASICLKYAKGTKSNREFAMGGDMYKKEIFFCETSMLFSIGSRCTSQLEGRFICHLQTSQCTARSGERSARLSRPPQTKRRWGTGR